jgi:hypothetical protein
VEFVSAASVQTTCPYCTSVLVRTDVDLRAVGVESTVPPTVSPIRLGTRGMVDGRRFQVVGRLVYAYERGRWNEWHLAYEDGSTGWLSDAQAEYAVTAQVPAGALPGLQQLKPGLAVDAAGERFVVSVVTRASYAGTEGELPFEQWQGGEMYFVDLRGERDGRFGTIDYSESPPLLYVGRSAEFGELHLSDLREPEQIEAAARTLACPNCGGSVTVRAADRTVNVVCAHCRSVLDARTPALQLLQTYVARIQHTPKIPLGARGTLLGETWEAIGFQVRSIRVEGVDYPWDEYLLFSPSRGFLYLTEYQGHWNRGQTIRSVPRTGGFNRPTATLDGRLFRHFQRGQAETTFVLGEFPWEVRAGDRAGVSDFVAPPFMLSSEETEGETTWTLSEYVPGAVIWKAFGLQGSPPAARGVYANQPAPAGAGIGVMWGRALMLVGVLLLVGIAHLAIGGRTVETRRFDYVPGGAEGEQAQVIGPLALDGRTSNVQVGVNADVQNTWAYFDFTLADSAGHDTQFGKEVSWYEGVEDGERWTEGSRSGSVMVPSVPPGRYWLRVEPQGERMYSYEVRVRRDVPNGGLYALAFVLLLIPPIVASVRRGTFEAARWAESDYAPS